MKKSGRNCNTHSKWVVDLFWVTVVHGSAGLGAELPWQEVA